MTIATVVFRPRLGAPRPLSPEEQEQVRRLAAGVRGVRPGARLRAIEADQLWRAWHAADPEAAAFGSGVAMAEATLGAGERRVFAGVGP